MAQHVEPSMTNRRTIWLRWVLANGAAVIVAMLAVLPLAVNLAYADQPAWLRGAVGGAALGLALGTVQWWLLRLPLAVDWRWIGYSVLGGALGLAIGMMVAESLSVAAIGETLSRNREPVFATGAALSAATGGLGFGLLLGGGQWLLLRRHVRSAFCWIVVNAIGWATGLGLAALFASVGVIGWLLMAGLVNGVFSGWLVERWTNTTGA